MSIYSRSVPTDQLKDTPLCDYTCVELASYILKRYKNAPSEYLNLIYSQGEIGSVLFEETRSLLEGAKYAKKYRDYQKLSK